jgi:RNA polymerase sigma factor (sigma-70 family)
MWKFAGFGDPSFPARRRGGMTLAIYPLSGPCENGALPVRRYFASRIRSGKLKVKTDQEQAGISPAEDVSGQILAIAGSADMEAFQSLFQAYSPRIRAYLLKLTRNPQASEDLMQETMLAIWRKAAQYDPARGPASAWIFTIARNIWIDAWRKQRRPEPDAANLVEQRQSHDALHKAMQTLPKEQIELIRLSFFDEASHSTIAKQLGLPIGTVKSRIRLAFGRLRTALEEGK